MHTHASHKPPKFDYTVGPISNGHIAQSKFKSRRIYIQINAQDLYFPIKQTSLKKFVVDQKLWSKHWANVIFHHLFQSDLSTFELWLFPNYCELFNYPWLTYVKLIIGAGDQRLLTGTKWGVYSFPSFNCACTASIVKSLKRQNIL